jgi:hypothetical protein
MTLQEQPGEWPEPVDGGQPQREAAVLPIWARVLVAVVDLLVTAVLLAFGFLTHIITGSVLGWFWAIVIIALSARNLYVYSVRGRPLWSRTRRKQRDPLAETEDDSA